MNLEEKMEGDDVVVDDEDEEERGAFSKIPRRSIPLNVEKKKKKKKRRRKRSC